MKVKTMINASDLEVALASYKSNHMQKLYKVQSKPYFVQLHLKKIIKIIKIKYILELHTWKMKRMKNT